MAQEDELRSLLVDVRANTGRLLRRLLDDHADLCGYQMQHALFQREQLRMAAHLLPIRRCCACGKVAQDAKDWGYDPGEAEVCQDPGHWSAWT